MTPPSPPRGRRATVYSLSKTLDMLVLGDGVVWFQRNHREPFVLSAHEARQLQALSRPEGVIVRGATRG